MKSVRAFTLLAFLLLATAGLADELPASGHYKGFVKMRRQFGGDMTSAAQRVEGRVYGDGSAKLVIGGAVLIVTQANAGGNAVAGKFSLVNGSLYCKFLGTENGVSRNDRILKFNVTVSSDSDYGLATAEFTLQRFGK